MSTTHTIAGFEQLAHWVIRVGLVGREAFGNTQQGDHDRVSPPAVFGRRQEVVAAVVAAAEKKLKNAKGASSGSARKTRDAEPPKPPKERNSIRGIEFVIPTGPRFWAFGAVEPPEIECISVGL
jgi:hypothetical protein